MATRYSPLPIDGPFPDNSTESLIRRSKERRRRILRWTALLAALVLTVAACCTIALARYRNPVISMVITNKTGARISNMTLVYTGGTKSVGPLASNSAIQSGIRVSGDSSLIVDYTDADGTKRRRDADIYLENDDRGTVALDLLPDRCVVRSQALARY